MLGFLKDHFPYTQEIQLDQSWKHNWCLIKYLSIDIYTFYFLSKAFYKQNWDTGVKKFISVAQSCLTLQLFSHEQYEKAKKVQDQIFLCTCFWIKRLYSIPSPVPEKVTLCATLTHPYLLSSTEKKESIPFTTKITTAYMRKTRKKLVKYKNIRIWGQELSPLLFPVVSILSRTTLST